MARLSMLFTALISLSLLHSVLGARDCGIGGISYPDTDVCECFQCYSGPACDVLAAPRDCELVAGRGDPSALFDYWDDRTQRFPNEKLEIPTNYRPSYGLDAAYLASQPLSGAGRTLVPALHELHKLAGNAVTVNKSIVFGAGATQIVNAACYAMAKKAGKPLALLTSIPHWFHYRDWAGFNPALTYWNDSLAAEMRELHDMQRSGRAQAADAASTVVSIDPNDVIEFVNHPNNPTGGARDPVFPAGPHLAMDLVYYWPGFTTVDKPIDESIMMFSMSKSSGHAGTRFGWAWVDDEQVAKDMAFFIDMQARRVSVDAQFRSLHLIRTMLETRGDVFEFVDTQMRARWAQINALFEKPRIQRSLRMINEAQGFFLWVECLDQGVTSCPDFWKSAFNVVGTSGVRLGGKPTEIRINVMNRLSEFNMMMQRLNAWADQGSL